MAYEGLRRFLALVPEVPVAEAQAQANMSDEEIEELMLLCTEILDSEKSNSLYDLSLLKRLDAIERAETDRMEQLSGRMDRLTDLIATLGESVVQVCMDADEVFGLMRATAKHGTAGTVIPLRPVDAS